MNHRRLTALALLLLVGAGCGGGGDDVNEANARKSCERTWKRSTAGSTPSTMPGFSSKEDFMATCIPTWIDSHTN